MSRLIDPLLCPDCRGRVLPSGTCSACGLQLTGPDATELWRLMLRADEVINRMRSTQFSSTINTPTTTGAVVGISGAAAGATATRPVPRKLINETSAKGLLLTSAGLLLFVAAVLFLAVTWQILPLAIKALIMFGITALFAGFGFELNRRGLRGSAETVWGLTGLLVLLDVSAAYRSGLLGLDQLAPRHANGIGGLLLVGLAVPAALLVTRTAAARSIAAECAIVIGAVAMWFGWVGSGRWNDGPQEAVAVPLIAAAAWALWPRLREVAWAIAGLAALTWLALGLSTLDGLGFTRAEYWSHGQGWPLAVAAGYAAVAAAIPRFPAVWRSVGAAAALSAGVVLGWLPVLGDTTALVILSLALLAISALALWRPVVWGRAARWCAVGLGALIALALAGVTAGVLNGFRNDPWFGHAAAHPTNVPGIDYSWALALAGLAVAAALTAAAEVRTRRGLVEFAPGPITFGLAAAVANAGFAQWIVVAAFAIAALATLAAYSLLGTHREIAQASSVAYAALSALLAALLAGYDARVSGVLAMTVTVALAVATWRLRARPRAGSILAALTVLTAGYTAWAWLAHFDAPERRILIVWALISAFVLVGPTWWRPRHAPARAWPSRIGFEIGAGLMALPAIVLAPHADVFATVLTIIGSGAALAAVLDRPHFAWPSSAVLGLATAVRYVDHVRVPERYCLPAAALLLGVGAYQMFKTRASSWQTLGAGVGLLLGPSLLIAVDHPGSMRTLLVAFAATCVVAVGLWRRWQAPLVLGVATLTALALRHLLPLARDLLLNPFGPWLMFGALGLTFLIVGILWEQSLRSLRRAGAYVADLR